MKNIINIIINFIKGLFNVQTLPDNTPVTDASDRHPVKKHNPAWWRVIYNLSSRDQVSSTSLYPLRPFGNAKACKPFARPKWYKAKEVL